MTVVLHVKPTYVHFTHANVQVDFTKSKRACQYLAVNIYFEYSVHFGLEFIFACSYSEGHKLY